MARDLSNLAAATKKSAGFPPDPNPRYGHLVAQAWHEQYEAERAEHHPTPREGPWFWASSAGSCARQLSYKMLGAEVTNPMTVADSWRFGLGDSVHDRLQTAVELAFPGAEREVSVDLNTIGLRGSGRIDLLIPGPPKVVAEIKSLNGYGAKMAVGARGEAEGPRRSALTQGALCALAADADELVIVYLFLELLSPREADKLRCGELGRFVAEWSYTREQFEPIALAEVERVSAILDLADKGELAPRHIPDMPIGARIVDPTKGAWTLERDGNVVAAGSHWGCAYCSWRDHCTDGGDSTVSTEDASASDGGTS